MRRLLAVLLVLEALACKKGTAVTTTPTDAGKRGRSAPICARQDCATKTIVDDGCDDEGRCLSCVNPCDLPP